MNNSGILILDKPAGMTSHDVVNRARRLYGTRQIGHTGTLDPMATGVLPLLVGRAVKASEYLSAHDKRYEAAFRLGVVSDTDDSTGTLRETGAPVPACGAVLAAAAAMRGRRMQTPPMISAVKIGGKKLLDYARQGQTPEVPPREIEIYEIEAAPLEKDIYTLALSVSKGTYVRAVIADLGRALGCGAVMTALRRTQSGGFSIDRAHTLEELEALEAGARQSLLLPVESAFSDLEALKLPDFYARLCKNGCEIYQSKLKSALPDGARVRLYERNVFFGLGEVRAYPAGSAVKMIKLFAV